MLKQKFPKFKLGECQHSLFLVNKKYLKIIPILIVFLSATATAITIDISYMLPKRLKFHKMLPNDLSNIIYKNE
ncbi:hypothetical protein CEN39_05770 [Fischerella thermalis CCMEE 5201]|nr:hypothetical protein CEN39_05770 [Fischerella thermalis CCMEE 5201]